MIADRVVSVAQEVERVFFFVLIDERRFFSLSKDCYDIIETADLSRIKSKQMNWATHLSHPVCHYSLCGKSRGKI